MENEVKKNSNKIFQTNETKIIFLDQYFPQVSQDCSVSCWWWFLMLHVVFSPWIWMTFCRESTAFSQGFWSNTDWDRGSTCGTCGQRLERETCCRYLWKDMFCMRKNTSNLHAQQGAHTGFGGIADSFEVMPTLQSHDHLTAGQWHQLTGQEAKTWWRTKHAQNRIHKG